jgi:hypothetical protein
MLTKDEVQRLDAVFYGTNGTLCERWEATGQEVISLYLARASGRVKEDVERLTHALSDADGQFHRAEDGQALSRLSAESEDAQRLLSDLQRLSHETDGGGYAPDLYKTVIGRAVAEAMSKRMAEATLIRMTLMGERDALQTKLSTIRSVLEGRTLTAWFALAAA